MRQPFFAGRASAHNFAHLLGMPSSASRRAEGPGNDPDEDEDARNARRAEEDKTREDEDARRAEEDDRRKDEDARRAEEDGAPPEDKDKDGKTGKGADEPDTPPEDKDKDGKKGKGAKGDDESDDDEMKGQKAERSRWATVLGHKNAAGGRIAAACTMLETTNNSADSIIATLAALPAQEHAKGPGLRDRMGGVEQPKVGADGQKAPSSGNAAKDKAAGFIAAARIANPDRVV